MNRIRINNNFIINRDTVKNETTKSFNPQNNPQKPFQEILNSINKNNELRFSKHALERLKTRDIYLSKSEINKISSAMQKANQKGVKEALILMDDKAFIASVKNNTIITAAVQEQLKDNVFTNIDGAVII